MEHGQASDLLQKFQATLPALARLAQKCAITLKSSPDLESIGQLTSLPSRVPIGITVNTSATQLDFPQDELRLGVMLNLTLPRDQCIKATLATALDAELGRRLMSYLTTELVPSRPDSVSASLAGLKELLIRLTSLESIVLTKCQVALESYPCVGADGSTTRRFIVPVAEVTDKEREQAEKARQDEAERKQRRQDEIATQCFSPALHGLYALAMAHKNFCVVLLNPLLFHFAMDDQTTLDSFGSALHVQLRLGPGHDDEPNSAAPAWVIIYPENEEDLSVTPRTLEALATDVTLELVSILRQTKPTSVKELPLDSGRLVRSLASLATNHMQLPDLNSLFGASFPAHLAALAESDVPSAARIRSAYAQLGLPQPVTLAFLSAHVKDVYPVAVSEYEPHQGPDRGSGLMSIQVMTGDVMGETSCCHVVTVVQVRPNHETGMCEGVAQCPKCGVEIGVALAVPALPLFEHSPLPTVQNQVIVARYDTQAHYNQRSPNLLPLTLRPLDCLAQCAGCGSLVQRQARDFAGSFHPCPDCGDMQSCGLIPDAPLSFVTAKGVSTRIFTRDVQMSISASRQRSSQHFKMGEHLPRNGACEHHKKSFRWFLFPCCGLAFPCDECHMQAHKQDPSIHGDKEPSTTASIIICGFCSFKFSAQRFKDGTDVICPSCGKALNHVSRQTSFWEGGQGTRDHQLLSRNDSHKHKTGAGKTISRAAARRQQQQQGK